MSMLTYKDILGLCHGFFLVLLLLNLNQTQVMILKSRSILVVVAFGTCSTSLCIDLSIDDTLDRVDMLTTGMMSMLWIPSISAAGVLIKV